MVHIVSKQDGPRKEDVALKRVLGENRGTIEQIKQALTGGGAPRGPAIVAPPPEATRAFGYRRRDEARDTSPYVRISRNGRVVIADYETGRQLHHVGDLKGARDTRHLVLATRENGFYAPLDASLQASLVTLDGSAVPDDDAEERLATDIAGLLGFAP